MWGATKSHNIKIKGGSVSIHAPMWGATLISKGSTLQGCFNPRSHVGSDDFDWLNKVRPVVSIHAPMWGATAPVLILSLSSMFQSTLPCGERHYLPKPWHDVRQVSIHAPMWGATAFILRFINNGTFQSTLPCGERQNPAAKVAGLIAVSIHAPMWGATAESYSSCLWDGVSIHAPMWGATEPSA